MEFQVIVNNRYDFLAIAQCECGQEFEVIQSGGSPLIHPPGSFDSFRYLEACKCGRQIGVWASDAVSRALAANRKGGKA